MREGETMNSSKREGLVAKCGLDCSICELYLSRDNSELLEQLVSKGIPRDKLPCAGCNANGGRCVLMSSKCETYKCAEDKDLRYCFECDDFPCQMYQPLADGANSYPHNLKVYNLSLIKSQGINYFLDYSQTIKDKYFHGKIALGKGAK